MKGRDPLGLWGLIVAGLCLSAAAAWFVGATAANRARQEISRRAATAAQLHATVLRSELEKHRSLPFVLAEDMQLHQALRGVAPATLARLNLKLETLSGQTRAAVIYLLDENGVAVAASNWRLPTSFVGTDYSFRPYFQKAMRDGVAEYFALGAVSGRPGLFLARRVVEGSKVLGVIVVKVEFGALEREWAQTGEPAFVVDEDGVVLVTDVPEWRFGVVGPLTPERRARLAERLQMPASALTALPIAKDASDQEVRVALPGAGSAQRYFQAKTETATPGWTLHLLEATDPYLPNSVTTARTLTFSGGVLTVSLIGIVFYRRRRARAVDAAREAARQELEGRVSERTSALRLANDRLIIEMDERRRAESNLHLLRDELVQASKLAVLGQVAAGVAHEINQPVGAIRAYAENARILMQRQEGERASRNVDQIIEMTQRVGLITDELRAFSRKSRGPPHPVPLEDPIAGALLLLGPRARSQGAAWHRVGDATDIRVLGDRARLEQVLVNLLQNALEALETSANPQITLVVGVEADIVSLTISDNGPGAPEHLRSQLFTPFVTSKTHGLGLGLVISRDIIRGFGGDLVLADTPSGATFVVTLRKAR